MASAIAGAPTTSSVSTTSTRTWRPSWMPSKTDATCRCTSPGALWTATSGRPGSLKSSACTTWTLPPRTGPARQRPPPRCTPTSSRRTGSTGAIDRRRRR
uniref:(northern house mosquito) hypothetical protein n=1 Tax=Culex pipiens TaxID=7175 RepID=A0A8D8DPA1_CULPI